MSKEKEDNSVTWAASHFWQGFFKEAAIKIPSFMPRMPKLRDIGKAGVDLPQGVKTMSEHATEAAKPGRNIKPNPTPLNYAKINEIKQQPAGTLTYGAKGAESYTPPPPKPSRP
jgi:hypothetical protein